MFGSGDDFGLARSELFVSLDYWRDSNAGVSRVPADTAASSRYVGGAIVPSELAPRASRGNPYEPAFKVFAPPLVAPTKRPQARGQLIGVPRARSAVCGARRRPRARPAGRRSSSRAGPSELADGESDLDPSHGMGARS